MQEKKKYKLSYKKRKKMNKLVSSSKSKMQVKKNRFALVPTKLPLDSYTKSLKEFLKIIKDFPFESQKIFIRKYQARKKVAKEKEEQGLKRHSGILSEYQKEYIIELSGRFFLPRQIMKIINEEWGISYYHPKSLSSFLRKNSEVIRTKRLKYTSDFSSLRLAHERPRLEELSLIFEDAKEENDKRMMLETIREIRQEVKGDKVTLEAEINNNINLTVQNHILNEYDSSEIARMAMIRLLEKHNINFLSIAHRLVKEVKEISLENNPAVKEKKFFPVKVGGVSTLNEKQIKNLKDREEKNVSIDIDNVKELVKKNLLKKIKNSDKVIEDVKYKDLESSEQEMSERVNFDKRKKIKIKNKE